MFQLSATEILIEVVGWTGAVLILTAYLLVSAGRLTGQSPLFQWMNLVGAIGFTINSAWHGAIPSATLNVIWSAIAIVALVRIASSVRRDAR
jgi:hypothetical protein